LIIVLKLSKVFGYRKKFKVLALDIAYLSYSKIQNILSRFS
jgi:hypothetical protein